MGKRLSKLIVEIFTLLPLMQMEIYTPGVEVHLHTIKVNADMGIQMLLRSLKKLSYFIKRE
jgi:hypothetical protein